jgi:hypothetical protein
MSSRVQELKSSKKAGPATRGKPEIERQVSLDEKLKKVIPYVYNISSSSGTSHGKTTKRSKASGTD